MNHWLWVSTPEFYENEDGSTRLTVGPAGERVRITSNPEVVRGCAYLGEAKATTRLGHAFGGVGTDDSERTLKNKVAEMGGNVVMIRRQDQNFAGSARSIGEVYKCSDAVLAPVATPTPIP